MTVAPQGTAPKCPSRLVRREKTKRRKKAGQMGRTTLEAERAAQDRNFGDQGVNKTT